MRTWQKFVSLALLVVMTFSAGYLAGQQSQTPAQAQVEEREEVFGTLFEVYDVLNANYIDPLDQELLLQGAIDGMVGVTGDDNTNYLDPEAYQRWNESLSGSFEGIGATVEKDEVSGGMRIISPLPNSPAEASGLQAGDIIIEVGGENITEKSLDEIISLVRGPAGTIVRLGIQREGEAELLEFTIVRDRIEFPDVEFRLLDNNVGYVRLFQFSDGSSQKLEAALLELDAENLNGLVLDLRNNPGGYLETALQVLSLFVSEGPILIEQLPGDEERVFEAYGGAVAPSVPMAILVDEGSASASELVAGGLRDLGRAVIVGMPTFGKNTVQTIQPLSEGGALRVTVARWVTPDGNSSQPDGFIPDVQVEFDPDSDPDFDNQLEAAIRALKGMKRQQLHNPVNTTGAF
jgi:carboxyl-terminal processing protease